MVPDASLRIGAAHRTLTGGAPRRLLRFTPAGWLVARRLLAGVPVAGAAEGGLARRLVDAGLAHPVPPVTVTPAAVGRIDGVSVVVPVRDRSEALARLLDAVAGRDGLPVVVVDDGSAEPAAVAAVCDRPGVRLLHRPVSGGPAAARNAGLALVGDAMVALLDSDVLPPAGWLAPLVAQLADPELAAVAPRVRPLGSADDSVLARYLQERSPLDMGSRPALVRPGSAVGYVPTAALLARRAALPAFDEGLRHGEDVDLVWRLVDAGWGVRYDPSVTVSHAEPARWPAALRRRRDYGSSAGPLAVRHGARLAPWRVAPAARRDRPGAARTTALGAARHRRSAGAGQLAADPPPARLGRGRAGLGRARRTISRVGAARHRPDLHPAGPARTHAAAARDAPAPHRRARGRRRVHRPPATGAGPGAGPGRDPAGRRGLFGGGLARGDPGAVAGGSAPGRAPVR